VEAWTFRVSGSVKFEVWGLDSRIRNLELRVSGLGCYEFNAKTKTS
jgi:hypothetical protein